MGIMQTASPTSPVRPTHRPRASHRAGSLQHAGSLHRARPTTRVPRRTTCIASNRSYRTSQRSSRFAMENLKWCFHRNQQYSIIALTNGSGTITERYAYSAYGTPTMIDASGNARTSSADNNRYTYTGREWDSSLSLYYYRARMFDSAVGRFCSNDPIGFAGGLFCLYSYVGGRSLVRWDPSGLIDGNGGGEFPTNGFPCGILYPNQRPSPPAGPETTPEPAKTPEPVEIEEEDKLQLVCNYYSKNPYPVVIKPGSKLHTRIFNSRNFVGCQEKAHQKAGELANGLGDGGGLGCWDSKSDSDTMLCKGVNNTGAMFSLGKSRITVTIECTVVGMCPICTEKPLPLTTCKIKYSIRDFFKEPLDLPFEPGGTPYPMDGDWEDTWGGCPGYVPAF
jgi:RHS repeat-associated protein